MYRTFDPAIPFIKIFPEDINVSFTLQKYTYTGHVLQNCL